MQLRAGGYRLPKDHTPVCGKIHSPKVIFGGLKSFKMKYIPKKKNQFTRRKDIIIQNSKLMCKQLSQIKLNKDS